MENREWEETSTQYGIERIDENLLIRYIREANDTGRLNYIYRNPEEALCKLGLINSDGHLNNAGYYLFGNDGPVLLKEVVYPTESRDTFTNLKQFTGNIFECIKEGMRYIQNNIHYWAEIVGAKRVETPEIPVKAIREIVVNSFAHCHYINGDYNEIAITASKVRIYNPGGIINNASPEEFASGRIGSKIRNPIIATVLFKCGLIDAFGTGFDRTFRACAENNTEYNYQNDEYGFTFIFNRKKTTFADDKLTEKINARITALDKLILTLLSDNPFLTLSELSAKTSKSEVTVHRHISGLIDRHMLERIGFRKTGYWQVVRTAYEINPLVDMVAERTEYGGKIS